MTASLVASLEQLAADARRISQALDAQAPVLSREAAFRQCLIGLDSAAAAAVLRDEVVGGRLLALAPDDEAQLRTLERALAGRHNGPRVAVDGIAFVLLLEHPRRGVPDPALHDARALWKQVAPRVPCRATISTPLARVADLAQAARDVRDLLAVLGDEGERLGLVEDSWARIVTRRLGAALSTATPLGSVLVELEDSPFLHTFLVWLHHDGDVAAASAALCLHPNTLRYRVRRVEQQHDLDLTDQHQRVALRLWALTRRVLPAEPGAMAG